MVGARGPSSQVRQAEGNACRRPPASFKINKVVSVSQVEVKVADGSLWL